MDSFFLMYFWDTAVVRCKMQDCDQSRFLSPVCGLIQATKALWLKGQRFFFLLFATLLSSRQEDTYHSFNCAFSNKEETGRVHPQLISLA